ncbi:AAA-type ATPase lid domain-containing protein, partial [Singulisphaera rosea]
TEDIPMLAEHFLAASARKLGRITPRLTLANAQQLQRYHWPGNVRELQHVIERAVITADGARLNLEIPSTLTPSSATKQAGPSPFRGVSESAERILTDADLRSLEADNIRAALRRTRGKISGPGGAAELIGIKPTTLTSRIKALGIEQGT